MSANGFAVQSWQFHLPKRGEKIEDYEDASAADPVRGRFAIADGAAGSSFSALWAQLLVEEFVGSSKAQPCPFAEWLPNVQERWSTAVNAGRTNGQKTPWFVEDRLQQGAFAAFLGLTLEEYINWRGNKKRRWRVLAIGDTCLFQVRSSQLYKALPLTRAKEFGNTPWLVGSRKMPDRQFNRQVTQQKGDWQYDDRLWLMTDALALWFIQQKEAGHKPWKELDSLLNEPDPERAFTGWVETMRSRQQIRNDDVTLLGVCL